MAEIINVTTKGQLKELYNCSAMTWEGLREQDFELAVKECGQEDAKGYVTCKPARCAKNQYIVSGKCVACPKGATCDGENPKCPRGYTKDKNGYVICK